MVLNGHIHTYARFALLNPSGAVDTTNGIREVDRRHRRRVAAAGGRRARTRSRWPTSATSATCAWCCTRPATTPSSSPRRESSRTASPARATAPTVPPTNLNVSQTRRRRASRPTRASPYIVTVTQPRTTDQTNVTLTDTTAGERASRSRPRRRPAPAPAPPRSSASSARSRPGASATVTVNAPRSSRQPRSTGRR